MTLHRQFIFRISLAAALLLLLFLHFYISCTSGQYTKARNDRKSAKYHPKDRIHISDIKALTFHRGKFTKARRTNSLPQLWCVGGTAHSVNYIPAAVQCKNMGR